MSRDRGGLRECDDHASWRSVYARLDVPVDQHDDQPHSDGGHQ